MPDWLYDLRFDMDRRFIAGLLYGFGLAFLASLAAVLITRP